LLVCDVSGHGISSALVANRIYTETVSLLERRIEGGEMLRQLNRFVTQQIRVGGFFFTMTLARINAAGDRMHYASGGHPPALLVNRGGEVRQIFARGTVLGLLDDAIPAEHASEDIALERGDRLVLYTDGLLEVWNIRDEELGLAGLTEIVQRASTLPLSEMKEQILAAVAAWRHGPVTDDVSLVLLERR
jgi:sigma-B regulation protein RsbU (phosphoserine phosphatase)